MKNKKTDTRTDEEVLRAAIEKAQKNGWYIRGRKVIMIEYNTQNKWPCWNIWFTKDKSCDMTMSQHYMIFSKDFCMAFWKEDQPHIFDGTISNRPCIKCGIHEQIGMSTTCKFGWNYQRHLMLDFDNPIEYLRVFVP